jgi:hypothetical protein
MTTDERAILEKIYERLSIPPERQFGEPLAFIGRGVAFCAGPPVSPALLAYSRHLPVLAYLPRGGTRAVRRRWGNA